MKDFKIFINLTRLNRPIGYLLLFWPCSWGLAYAYSLNKNIEILNKISESEFNEIVSKDSNELVPKIN